MEVDERGITQKHQPVHLSLPRWGQEKEGGPGGEGRAASSALLPLTPISGPLLIPLVLTWLCVQSLSTSSSSPQPPPGPATAVFSSVSPPLPLLPQILSLLCSEPSQGSYLMQRKSPSPDVPESAGPLCSPCSVPLSVLTVLQPHSTPCCCPNAWHDATPGPLHQLLPTLNPLFPHLQVCTWSSFSSSRAQFKHLLIHRAQADPLCCSPHDPVLQPAHEHLKSRCICFPNCLPHPAPWLKHHQHRTGAWRSMVSTQWNFDMIPQNNWSAHFKNVIKTMKGTGTVLY